MDPDDIPLISFPRILPALNFKIFNRKANTKVVTEDDVTKESTSCVPWESLPIVPLTMIFSYLDDHARANASAVCQQWNVVFQTASLWRSRTFSFGRHQSNKNEVVQMLGYARNFGNHLRDLKLNCNHMTFNSCKLLQKGLGSFFAILRWKKTRIRKFEFNNIHSDQYWRIDFIRNRLITALCRFLQKQHGIDTFEMWGAALPISGGQRIIDTLAKCSGNSISSLNIEDFFAPRAVIYCMNSFKNIMSRFTNLTCLQTNYNYLNSDILSILSENCGQNLIHIAIKVYRFDPHLHRIDGATWTKCKRSCPNLTVNVSFDGIGDYADIVRILCPEVPLTAVNIWTGLRHFDDNWRINDSIMYLVKHFSKILEDVYLSLETGEEQVDGSLLQLVRAGHCLDTLEVHAPVQVTTMEQICKMQEEFRICLDKCHITSEKLTAGDLEEMEELEGKYEMMFYERGVDFRFIAADIPYFSV